MDKIKIDETLTNVNMQLLSSDYIGRFILL